MQNLMNDEWKAKHREEILNKVLDGNKVEKRKIEWYVSNLPLNLIIGSHKSVSLLTYIA